MSLKYIEITCSKIDLLQEHPYGLRSARNATRGLQSVIQAYIIKYLVFDQRPKDKKSVTIDQ